MSLSAPRSLFLLLSLGLTLGCHAQKPTSIAAGSSAASAPGTPVSPELGHRIEVMLRQKANLPPGSTMNIGNRTPSELPGWDTVPVTFSNEGKTSHPIDFLVSADGKTLAQFNKYDISANPRFLVSPEGRPARGGPENAPVLIVGFDDLECPYCARLHESLFPLILNRYGNSIRIVYKDFPLEQHPWAMRAAVDVNCLGAQSTPGYWNAVDYIHAHSAEIGQAQGAQSADAKDKTDKTDKTVPRANEQLDKIVRQQAEFQKIDLAKFDACIAKQDSKAVEASRQLGVGLGVDSTPSLFINGDKIDGAVPPEFIFARIDDALRAAGQTPPAPYVAPVVPPPAPAAPAKSTGGTGDN